MTTKEMIDELRRIADDVSGKQKDYYETIFNNDTWANLCRNVANKVEELISQKRIYVITKGHYSDYGICAVTTDKAKAEELRLFFSDEYDDANIEEYEDGESIFDNKLFNVVRPFFVTGERKNLEQNKDLISSVRQYTKILYQGEMFATEMSYHIANDSSDWLDLTVLAPDEEHAKKIWYDTWAKLNAENLDL